MRIRSLNQAVLVLLTLCQFQSVVADPVKPQNPQPIQTTAGANLEENYLVIAGSGNESSDRSLIVMQIRGATLFSFKYCSLKSTPEDENMQAVREAYLLDATNTANNAIAKKLFLSSSCELITSNNVYVMHILSEDPNSAQLVQGLQSLKDRSYMKDAAIGSEVATAVALLWAGLQFYIERPSDTTINLMKFIFSKKAGMTLPMSLGVLFAAGAGGAEYFELKSSREFRTLNTLKNFVERQGRLLEVDGSISSMRHALESGLIDSVKHGEISVL